ncbi:MAG: kynureninase [bacterium]|nr:kynureninase [bacterium]
MNDGSNESRVLPDYAPEEAWARAADEADPLRGLRDEFHVPQRPDGSPAVYLCGNSLGLQPRGAAAAVTDELDDWSRLAVDAHFDGKHPWYSYHEPFREPLARLVGASPDEVVAMNGLTVNLHLMLASFFRPTAKRYKILMEECAFPSDTYAAKTQLQYHGFDPEGGVIAIGGAEGESAIATESFEQALERHADEIALVLLGGVNYFTGQVFDMQRIARAARERGCVVGLDLAHAVGNVELGLHDWDVDFAVWCHYKYLNAGPGAVAGCFVHERHARRTDLPRFGGWWGNDPGRRFRMHLEPRFEAQPGADGWQLSNPPILALAPLRASLDLFDRAGMQALRSKSKSLTGYLQYWIERAGDRRIEVRTPPEPAARGCQLSLRVLERPRELFDALTADGIVADYREPDVVRVAPVPLYNTFRDVRRFGRAVCDWAGHTEDREA